MQRSCTDGMKETRNEETGMQKQYRCALFTLPFLPGIYSVNLLLMLELEKPRRKSSSGLCQLSCWLHPKDLTGGSSLEWGVLLGATWFLHQTGFCMTCSYPREFEWWYWVGRYVVGKTFWEATSRPDIPEYPNVQIMASCVVFDS